MITSVTTVDDGENKAPGLTVDAFNALTRVEDELEYVTQAELAILVGTSDVTDVAYEDNRMSVRVLIDTLPGELTELDTNVEEDDVGAEEVMNTVSVSRLVDVQVCAKPEPAMLCEL